MNTKLILTIVIVLVVIIAGWYIMSMQSNNQNPAANEQAVAPTDTTANIANDLNKLQSDTIPGAELNSLDQSVNGY